MLLLNVTHKKVELDPTSNFAISLTFHYYQLHHLCTLCYFCTSIVQYVSYTCWDAPGTLRECLYNPTDDKLLQLLCIGTKEQLSKQFCPLQLIFMGPEVPTLFLSREKVVMHLFTLVFLAFLRDSEFSKSQ